MSRPLSHISIEAIFENFYNEDRWRLKSRIPFLRMLKHPTTYSVVSIRCQKDSIEVVLDANNFNFTQNGENSTKIERKAPPTYEPEEFQMKMNFEEVFEKYVKQVINRKNITIEQLYIDGSNVLKYFKNEKVNPKVLELAIGSNYGYTSGTFLKFPNLDRIYIESRADLSVIHNDLMKMKLSSLRCFTRTFPLDTLLNINCEYLAIKESRITIIDFWKILRKYSSGALIEGSHYKSMANPTNENFDDVLDRIFSEFRGICRFELENGWNPPKSIDNTQLIIRISENLELFVNLKQNKRECEVRKFVE